MIRRFLGAVQFLTTAPIRGWTAPPGQCVAFFPIVGGAIGYAGALLLMGTRQFVDTSVSAALVLTFWALATGGLHEDGFADVADAFRAGRPRERILAILKDSRIGAHGALALILITLLRWESLSTLAAPPLLSLPATFAVSRGAMVALAWVTPPAGAGLAVEFSKHMNSAAAILALLGSFVAACFAPAGLLLAWGAFVIVVLARIFFMHRIAGVNGDCLGATALLVETWGLALYSCPRCM
jgi:adenosylcobinamide-GDP ribazoletransferase